VCLDARSNSPCLAVRRNAQNRDDTYEAKHADKGFADLDPTPPCLAERGTFLSPVQLNLRTQLDYSRYSPDHSHILPGNIPVPAYGGTLTPFRWMLREFAWDIADEHGLDVSQEREPQKGSAPDLIVNTPWVQNCDNQRALLEGFAKDLAPEGSLVFFYAKQTPLSDGLNRQIVAVAKLLKLGGVAEYPYEGGSAGGRIRSTIWERPFQHSLRPNPNIAGAWLGGVVLPYHALLDLAETGDIQPANFLAEVPTEAYAQFRYASEQVSHGSAITALQAVRRSLERSSSVLSGPWEEYFRWIDGEMSQLWSMHGNAPGLGSALSCFDPNFNGTLFAHSLAGELDDGEDPWPAVEAILGGSREPPSGAPKIKDMQKRRFAYLKQSDSGGYELMQLLSRFELNRDQAKAIYDEADAGEVLANPYRMFEMSRNGLDPISLTTIDRSLYPAEEGLARPPLPDSLKVDLDEPEHPLRLRAIAVDALESAASNGDTILSAQRLNQAVEQLPLSASVTVDAITLEICSSDFAPEVAVTKTDGSVYAQLNRYTSAGTLIRSHVTERVETLAEPKIDWAPLVDAAFGGGAAISEDERRAREEKVTALKTLEASRVGVLTGPAGTGKTTLLKILLGEQTVVGRDVLLLAPTGKARVRLGQQTGRHAQAKTLAQFLLQHGRYDTDTGQYLVIDGGSTANVTTCVVDECSMLTEDQLASLCSVLPKSARLILVGDPQQLPPIGAGRPFVDIIAHLKERGGAGLAELAVSRRQDGGHLISALSLPDVQLASLFSGRPLPPGEDEIAATAEAPTISERLRFLSWDAPSDLRDKILDVLGEELGARRNELEEAVELSLGGTAKEGSIYFNSGAGEKAEDWQILSAHRNLASGSAEINRFLKQTVRTKRLELARNPPGRWKVVKPRGSDQITYGDKVICVRNHQRKSWSREEGVRDGYIANGEVGLVTGETAVGARPRFTKIEFASQKGEVYSFKDKDFSEEGNPFLELAYAVTVHKAQGSEFGTVILVLPANSRLLSREMLYTALTRQKNRVWVLHQGPFSEYLKLRSDFYSETRRRSTNLFGPPVMYDASIEAAGGVRTGWLAEQLIHHTRRGDLVSSKSELIIADILHELESEGKIRYSFEKPLTDAAGVMRLPDFTIDAGSQTWFWEHCGLMGQSDYVQRWERKLKWYEDQGITPWSEANPRGRLIVTEDSLKGGIDSGAIHALASKLFV
jgi:ATP-dependent exoDNAse (exonuclease V) alpha subunit